MPKLKQINFKKLLIPLAVIAIFFIGAASGFFAKDKIKPLNQVAGQQQNAYVAFTDEVYTTIKDNYWQKLEDKQLIDLFVSAKEHISGQIQTKKIENKEELLKMVGDTLQNYDKEEQKKEFVATLADAVLANLEPAGRSRLYTQKQEKELSENVQNINPNVNQYETLGVNEDSSQEEIDKAYQEESDKWNPETNDSPEAEQKYQEVQKAYEVLGDEDARKTYDISGAEPTMQYKMIGSKIFYIHITKFSPTTVEELQRVTDKVTDDSVDTLILDLSGNIGGAIDGLPFFLGPFIGPDQYAYQFFHQGDKTDYKTKTGWLPGLVKYKKVVVLIDEQSQSTAEVMAATLKKYNVGVLVGTTTRGWGTVEKVFELKNQFTDDEKYSILLVHSLTLREDNQPIEGNGVEPNIDITEPNWENQLYSYYNSQELVNAVKEVKKL